jgi:hypothetical protein
MSEIPEVTERPAEAGEVCTCGRPARVVFVGGAFGDTGWCGRSDGGADRGKPCPWCESVAEFHGRCPRYRVRPEAPR